MHASSPRSVMLAELDAMVARAEAACERRRHAVLDQRLPRSSARSADLHSMERELARLRACRDAHRKELEARSQRDRS
jgi:hypothetical protein